MCLLCPTYRYARLIPGINFAPLIPHTCLIHPNWDGSSGIRNGPTHRKPDRERLRKMHWGVYRGCKILAIDSIGHGRTRPFSLCVGSIGRKSDREILRKIHWGVYRGCKMLADRLRWTRTDTTRPFLVWNTNLSFYCARFQNACHLLA